MHCIIIIRQSEIAYTLRVKTYIFVYIHVYPCFIFHVLNVSNVPHTPMYIIWAYIYTIYTLEAHALIFVWMPRDLQFLYLGLIFCYNMIVWLKSQSVIFCQLASLVWPDSAQTSNIEHKITRIGVQCNYFFLKVTAKEQK